MDRRKAGKLTKILKYLIYLKNYTCWDKGFDSHILNKFSTASNAYFDSSIFIVIHRGLPADQTRLIKFSNTYDSIQEVSDPINRCLSELIKYERNHRNFST